MSVLNQMLRDLEKRGAMPAVVAAAGTATVARPALAAPAPTFNTRRRWIWAGVLAVAAVFVAVHSWLSYRVQEAGVARQPLGAREFAGIAQSGGAASVVVPPAATAPVAYAPVPTPVPATVAAATSPASKFAAGEATNPPAATARASAKKASPPRVAAQPDPPAHAREGVANGASTSKANTNVNAKNTTAVAAAAAAEATAPAIVVRSSNSVAADVDRAADLIARGRSTEAMELLARVLARQPAHAAARSSLAALLAEAGRREQALHVLLAGAEQDPARFAAPAAQLQAELGDLAGALGTLARVPQAQRSAHDEALYAGIAQRAGDHMTAIAAYRRALLLPQADPVGWVGLGVSLEATGDAAAARDAYQRAAAESRLPADVRRYVADRLTVLGAQASRTRDTRKAALADVF